ncbi:beta-lactamase family protein [Streptomyces sp. APSN-46.1]|uniref:serine hydrolase domain-containing protein n=1 Tax=Streptomyces sp. APSN-46.1 TaxID=2929049 RepID=UPI001FB425CB|nr:serine hydrolase domain-containing protein [Streptomyces sp. APSN-46.1]MCJ1678218.1 beta-lactamase family protein [Streptomyces sp. APSN-46.1]
MATRWRGAAAGVAAVGLVVVPLAAGSGYAGDAPTPGASITSAPATDDAFPRLTPAVAARLDEAVQKVMTQAKVPGVMVSLSAPGKGEYVRTFGVADKATRAPMETDMHMRIGSATKTFTVTALLQLVDEGKVGLDDPIGKYIDGVPNGDRITLRQLAEMRSGLFNYSEDAGFDQALFADPDRVFTPEELLAYSFKHPVMFEPGAKFFYSNTNLILLGLVVEKISGENIADYINHKVVEPAKLTNTLFPKGGEFPEPHAHGYTNQTESGKVEDATDWDPSWAWAAGAMISDLDDLRSWAKTLATGTLLTPATQAERLKVIPVLPGAGYGLGIFNIQGWLGHNGSLPGYESLVMYLPEAQATLVVLLNTDIMAEGEEPSTLFGEAITEIVTPDHVYSLPAHTTAK